MLYISTVTQAGSNTLSIISDKLMDQCWNNKKID